MYDKGSLYTGENIFIKMLNNVGMALPKIIQTRCNTYAARQWMIAYNNNNMRNPIIKEGGGYTCYCCMLSSTALLHMYCTLFV